MHEKRKPFKKPSKKNEPKGLTVLYEDQEIIVVNKSNGLLTIGTDKEKLRTAHFALNEYVKRGYAHSKNRVYVVHRLDRDTSGVLIFAKSENSKKFMQDEWLNFSKKYFAVVHGKLNEKEGEIESYLAQNKIYRMYSVNNPKLGKYAKTAYKVVAESHNYSLLEVFLLTGRKNQIRVHLSEKGHPVVGDKTYGDIDKANKKLALHSFSLSIIHPLTKENMTFEAEIPSFFNSYVKI